MTSTLNQISAGLCLLLCLATCASSPPSNFYRLTPAVAHVPGGPTPSLGIGPVDIPEFLNRNALVYTRGGNQLQLAESERWAEPLDDGITRVLGGYHIQADNVEGLKLGRAVANASWSASSALFEGKAPARAPCP